MISRLHYLFALLVYSVSPFFCKAQTVANKDGSALATAYCRENRNYAIVGQPAGGTFSGCGVFQQNGEWYFNPSDASVNESAFPFQCMLSYTVNGTTIDIPIVVWKPVDLTLTADTSTCDGNFSMLVQARYAGDYSYAWMPAGFLAQPTASFTTGHIQQNQAFVCTVTDLSTGCAARIGTSIVKHAPPELTVTNDALIPQHTSLQLAASGADTYEWSPGKWLDNAGIAAPVSSPEDSITYTVTGTNQFGCKASAQVHIDLSQELYFPSAFSPNGDGLNDEFRIVNFGHQYLKEFRVFNRWGQQVFFTLNGTRGWDGTYNNRPAEAGTYHYLIRIEVKKGTEQVLRGDLTLVR